MDLKIRLIETRNASKYKSLDYHWKPFYMTTQTRILLSSDSDSDSDLDSSGEGNKGTGQVQALRSNINNVKKGKEPNKEV